MSSHWNTIELELDQNKDGNINKKLEDDLNSLIESIRRHYRQPNESKNLIGYFEDKLLVWQAEDQCLFCCRLKDSRKMISIQTLALTNPPKFSVDTIEFSLTGRYLALYGSRGINVIELPRKWILNETREGDKRFILARSWCIAERFFVCNQRVELLCCEWHPACQLEKHIVLLTNDNYLRIYHIDDEQTPSQTINLSWDPKGNPITDQNYISSIAMSLGEIAVSFDFGPPISKCYDVEPSTITMRDECLWPIYILRGNGDVLLVYSSLKYSYVSKSIMGPLTMMPSAEDNYGADACSLLCLDCIPPVLVIATSSGILHHCIAFDSEDDSNGQSNDRSLLPQPILYVYESIELLLSLTSSIDDQNTVVCPIRLHLDSLTPMRYYASHSCGTYAVAIPFVSQIKSQFNETNFIEEESIVEHLICTKTNSNNDSLNTPLGLVIAVQHGFSCLIVLLNSGEFISKRLTPTFLTTLLDTNQEDNEDYFAGTLAVPQVNFIQHVNQILKRTASAPLLKSNSNQFDSQKSLQLLLTTIEIIKKEYIKKYELAVQAIQGRAKALIKHKQVQMEEIKNCYQEKDKLILTMEELANKYDEALKKQDSLSQRIDMILQCLNEQLPALSEAEIELRDKLKQIKTLLNSHSNKLEQVQIKHEYQQKQQEKNPISSYDQMMNSRIKNYEFMIINSPSANQISSIKQQVSEQGKLIADMVHTLNRFKQQ